MTVCKLLLPNGRTATLGNGLKWVSDDDVLTLMLNGMFPPDEYPSSPAHGPDGTRQAQAAAEHYKAKIEWTEYPQPTGEVVY